MTFTQDVSRIARRTGLTCIQVAELADDLGIEMKYGLADRSVLEIVNPDEAALFTEHLIEYLDINE